MAWIAGLATAAGGIIGNALNRSSAHSAQDFSQSMANTQMQRRVRDLQKAGLNPMLAIQQGGAASPQGVYAPQQNFVGEGVQAYSSAASAQKAEAETETIDQVRRATVNLVKQEVLKAYEETAVAHFEGTIKAMESKLSELSVVEMNAILPDLIKLRHNEKLRSDLGLPAAANANAAEQEIWGAIGARLKALGLSAGGVLNSAGSAAQVMGLFK